MAPRTKHLDNACSNEFEYLCDILDRLSDLPSLAELREMLPDRGKPRVREASQPKTVPQ